MDDETVARVARALAHPARVRILRLLADQTECRGAEVFSELPLAQSTISEHLRILKDAGLVTSQPVGTGMVYCLVPRALSEFRESVSELATTTVCSSDRNGC
jgi:ArsR family transcriptional regulator